MDRLCCKVSSGIDLGLSMDAFMLRVPQRLGMASDSC